MHTAILPDGRAVFNATDRVLVYVHYRDLRHGCGLHRYDATPKRIRQLADGYGEVLMSFVFQGPDVKDRIRAIWIGEGFQVMDDGPCVVNHSGPASKTEGVSQMPYCILRQVDVMHPNTVIIVASSEAPPLLIAALRDKNVKVVLVSPDRSTANTSCADLALFLKDVVDGQTPPPIAPEPASERPATMISSWVSPFAQRRAMDHLELTDPETYGLLETLLTVDEQSTDALLRMLKRRAQEEKLPKLVLTVLFVLGGIPTTFDAGRLVWKNRLWDRCLRLGIDIDTTGRMALRLLVEEGALTTLDEHDFEFARDHRDPPHAVAKAFCQSMVKCKHRVRFIDSSTEVGERMLQALEILTTNPGDLTPAALKDIQDLILTLLSARSIRERMQFYAERGIVGDDVLRFESRLREILDLLPENTNTPSDTAGPPSAPGIASTVRRRSSRIRASA